MDIGQKALELHKNGYNCAQSVVCAFAQKAGEDESALFKAVGGLGFGCGSGEQVCGAVSGAIMACGLCTSSGRPGDVDSLMKSLGMAKQLTQEFGKKNGSVICKELKGIETGKVIRTCNECIVDAANLAEEIISQNKDGGKNELFRKN